MHGATLLGQGNIDQGFLVSNMEKATPVLTSLDLKDVLIDNSPLSAVVLSKVSTSANLTAADKLAVLAANGSGGGSGGSKGGSKGGKGKRKAGCVRS
jgi:hypothetical protein